jgi:hypothetical protein
MTVEEVLKQSGFTDEQIRALEPKAITAFGGVLSAAEQERTQAEVARRANEQFYEGQIAPSLVAWDEEKSRLDADHARLAAEAAYYREAARAAGLPMDAPGVQPRDGQGRYVAGAPGGTPGSPQFFDVKQVYERAGDAIGTLTDIQWEHQRLFGQPLPISPSELVRKADAVKLDPRTYAARTFGWDAKQQEIAAKQQADHDDKIRREAEQANDRKWAERIGSNPDIRAPQASRFSDIVRARRANEIPDPLEMNETQRRQATAQMIRKDMAEQSSQ